MFEYATSSLSILTPLISPVAGFVLRRFLSDPGTISEFHNDLGDCKICSAGKYASSSGSVDCAICPAGKYNNDRAVNPSAHEFCTLCSPGTMIKDNATRVDLHDSVRDCETCLPNTYSNHEEGVDKCRPCVEGEIAPSRASACGACPTGYDCNGTTLPCPAGKYSNGDTIGKGEEPTPSCVPCEKGHMCPGEMDRQEVSSR